MNLLVTSNYIVKVADFGSASFVSHLKRSQRAAAAAARVPTGEPNPMDSRLLTQWVWGRKRQETPVTPLPLLPNKKRRHLSLAEP
jgi:hypothetical protein